jgi:hypothetical protein
MCCLFLFTEDFNINENLNEWTHHILSFRFELIENRWFSSIHIDKQLLHVEYLVVKRNAEELYRASLTSEIHYQQKKRRRQSKQMLLLLLFLFLLVVVLITLIDCIIKSSHICFLIDYFHYISQFFVFSFHYSITIKTEQQVMDGYG